MTSINEGAEPAEFDSKSIIIAIHDLEILTCVTHELGEIQEPRLIQLGSTTEDVRETFRTLRGAAEQASADSFVQIIGGSSMNDSNPTRLAQHLVVGDRVISMQVYLKSEVFEHLRQLCMLVLKVLSARELWYRTGYSIEEVQSVLAKLDP